MTNPAKNQESVKSSLQEELQHGRALLKVYIQQRRELELRAAQYSKESMPIGLQIDLDSTKEKIADVESKIKELEITEQSLTSNSTADIPTTVDARESFTPDWSVARSEVRYVDANLALKFADTAHDVDVFLGFTTLFLGAAISFIVSLKMSDVSDDIKVLQTAFDFSALITFLFSVLTVRAWLRAEALKKQLFGSDKTK